MLQKLQIIMQSIRNIQNLIRNANHYVKKLDKLDKIILVLYSRPA